MTSFLRLLVVEGNTKDVRSQQRARGEPTYGELYSGLLQKISPDISTEVCYPSDHDSCLPKGRNLNDYNGAVITGSALNIYNEEPETQRQIDLVRAILKSGVPVFGSCWGLQVAAVAAGGVVRRSPRGREIGFARKIVLTDAGRVHPMHAGKLVAYDAPSIHTDEVSVHPAGMIVTAGNEFSAVQAAEIKYENGVFWGVQYHPEFSLSDMASVISRFSPALIDQGLFSGRDDLDRYAQDLRDLEREPQRYDIQWRLGLGQDVIDFDIRTLEIRNWIEFQVKRRSSG